tara:strand:+ start:2264 stop:2488 length:225 start_codon:yes stop_codon:yes gene_type:complete
MKIEKDDFVECTASLDSFQQLLQEKTFQVELENQQIRDKTNFFKKLYYLAIFSGFLISMLGSTYLLIEILTKLN